MIDLLVSVIAGLVIGILAVVFIPPLFTVLTVAYDRVADRVGIGRVVEAYYSWLDYWVDKEREWNRGDQR